jgi:hypothetical protein
LGVQVPSPALRLLKKNKKKIILKQQQEISIFNRIRDILAYSFQVLDYASIFILFK